MCVCVCVRWLESLHYERTYSLPRRLLEKLSEILAKSLWWSLFLGCLAALSTFAEITVAIDGTIWL